MGRAWVEAPDEAGQGHSRLIGALMALTVTMGRLSWWIQECERMAKSCILGCRLYLVAAG